MIAPFDRVCLRIVLLGGQGDRTATRCEPQIRSAGETEEAENGSQEEEEEGSEEEG
jgi:hypothetical protein